MTTLTTSMPTSPNVGATELADYNSKSAASALKFEQSLARMGAIPASEGPNRTSTVDAIRPPEDVYLAQANSEVEQSNSSGGSNNHIVTTTDPANNDSIGTAHDAESSIKTAVVETPAPGDGIIDGLSKLRGVFDAQEQAITGVSRLDVDGTRLTNSTELITLQFEMVKYSMLMDVTSKFAGKATQTMDALMKGQ